MFDSKQKIMVVLAGFVFGLCLLLTCHRKPANVKETASKLGLHVLPGRVWDQREYFVTDDPNLTWQQACSVFKVKHNPVWKGLVWAVSPELAGPEKTWGEIAPSWRIHDGMVLFGDPAVLGKLFRE